MQHVMNTATLTFTLDLESAGEIFARLAEAFRGVGSKAAVAVRAKSEPDVSPAPEPKPAPVKADPAALSLDDDDAPEAKPAADDITRDMVRKAMHELSAVDAVRAGDILKEFNAQSINALPEGSLRNCYRMFRQAIADIG